MKKIIKLAAFGVAILISGTSSAQQTYTGYFLDNYTYRYQMNPAFANESNFVSMPGIGNINVAMRGNLHLNSVLYNRNGETVLFTNPDVSAATVLDKIHNNNRVGAGIKIDLLSGGFKAWDGYNTISIGAVANANARVPKSFFQLAKEGLENQTYDIKNLDMQANAYVQIALNHSREIPQVPGLRAGAAMKFYVGMANLDAYFDKAQLQLGENSWNAVTNANIYSSLKGMRYKMERNKHTDMEYVSGLDGNYGGANGFGIGFDLGATYKWRDFNFSLAVLDLGFISWGKTQWASTDGDREFNTDAYTFNANDQAPNSFEKEWEVLRDDLSELYQLKVMDPLSSRTRAMAATLNVGVDYELPYYRPLHFGLLSSTVINGRYTWTQMRISANVAPVKWVSASANLEVGTFGAGFGWLLNFYTKGFNAFVGMDHTMGKLAKQGVPLNSNAAFNFGINFPF